MNIDSVVIQFVEEASFLWQLRERAVRRPDYLLDDIVRLDERIEANIDGLRVVADDGWSQTVSALEYGEAGEFFVAAVLAMEGRDDNRMETVLGVATESREAFRGLISALGWLSREPVDRWISDFAVDSRAPIQAAALAGSTIRREASLAMIRNAMHQKRLLTHGRALRAVGEMKYRNLLPDIQSLLDSDREACRFWSAWSGSLMGDNVGLKMLTGYASSKSKFALRAMWLVPRLLQPANAERWLRDLAQNQETRRNAIIGCGIAGDPVYVPKMIGIMSDPFYARVAGETISMITGLDIEHQEFDADWPEGFEAGPSEDPEDENVDLDEDEDLPWPDQALIQKWWDANGGQFQQGVRYLCGRPISDESCRRVLREGYQRQRIAAAYELALMNSDEPLFEWRAPGFKQQELLGIKRR